MELNLKFLIPLSVSVVIFNTVAIWLVAKNNKERKKSTSMILISLLVSDMMIGAVVIPTRIIDVLLHQSAIFPFIYAYLLLVAAFNVLLLSWDRYTSIGRPLQWKMTRNGRVRKILVATWLVPIVISLAPLAWIYNPKYRSEISMAYRYFLIAVFLSVIFIVVVFQVLLLYELYGFWYGNRKNSALKSSITKHQRKASIRKKVTSAMIIIGVTLSTVLTWLPTIVLNFRPLLILTWVAKLSLYSFFVNSLVDPLLVLVFSVNSYRATLSERQRRRQQRKNEMTLRNAKGQQKLPDKTNLIIK